MNKTVKVNLGGFVFQLDEDAYELLKAYVLKLEQKYSDTSEGLEIINDIEGRIAELLLNALADGREIVSRIDVEEVLALMGEPEAYMDEEDGEDSKSRPRSRGKLYREPENAVIGGVAAGIATHLKINSAWVRLAFLISMFAWTFGFWAYIVFWIVLPKRNTPLYRSQDVNESALVQLLNGIFKLLGNIVKVVFRIVTVLLGVSLILAGLPVLLVLLGVSIFPALGWINVGSWGISPQEVFSFIDFAMVQDASLMGLVLFLIVTIIPVFLLTYWGVRLLFFIKVKDAWLHITAGVMWVVASVLLGLVVSPNATLFVENESSYERIEISLAPDTLWMMVDTPIDREEYDRSISLPEEEMTFFYNKEKKKSCGLVELDMHNSMDSLAYYSIKKEACGSSRSSARQNLNKISYHTVHNNNHLALDEGYITTSVDMPWIPAHVEVDVFVPASTVLVVDKRLKRLSDAEDSFWRLNNKIVYVDMD